MDEDNIPGTIDQETPLAAPHVRQRLVRLSAALSKRSQVAFGVEESDPEVVPPSGVAGKVENIMPDLTARFRINGERGHVQHSGFVGRPRFQPTVGNPTDVTIGAVLLSARFRPVGSDAAYAQIAYGPGLGRYRSAVSVAPDASGRLRAVQSLGLTVGYQRYWSPRWSSNVVASPIWIFSDLGDPASTNKRLNYVAVNMLYWFLPKRAWAGVEYLYGHRKVRSGARGTANRIQFAVRFNILE